MWAPVPGATKYNIYLNGKKIAAVTAIQHIVPAPTLGGEFKYQVSAVDASGAESPPSSAGVVRIIMIEPPSNLVARPDVDRVPIRWKAAEGAVIYDVFRRKKGDSNWKMIASVTETRYEDTQANKGIDYQYAVKSKDSSGKFSEFSAILDIALLVPKAADKVRKKVEYNLQMLPAELDYRAELDQYPTDAALCDNRMALSAYNLYIIKDVTEPEALWETDRILLNDKNFMGLTWSEDCELIYVNHAPSGQLWVVDPDGGTEELPGSVVEKYNLPAPPDGPRGEEGTLFYFSVNTKGKVVTIQKKGPTRPSDVVLTRDGDILVGDLDNNRLLRLDSDGEFIETLFWEDEEVSNNPKWAISKPMSIVRDSKGDIFSTALNHILHMDLDKEEKTQIGGPGTIFGTFTSVKGLFIDSKDNLYATDGRAGNIQVFQKHEGFGWIPVYVITTPDKKGNLETLTPMAVLVTDDEKNMIVVESMSKTLAYYNLQWDKADPVKLPESK